MRKRHCRNHSAVFKARVASAAVKGEATLAELAQPSDIHPSQVTQWKSQLLEWAADLFASAAEGHSGRDAVPLEDLHAKIGQQALELIFYPARSDGFLDRAQSDDQRDP